MRHRILKAFHRLKRHPNQWVRVGFGLALVLGGLLGPFLPVLGIWMLPLGLILLFANSPVYWRLRRRFVAWRRRRRGDRNKAPDPDAAQSPRRLDRGTGPKHSR